MGNLPATEPATPPGGNRKLCSLGTAVVVSCVFFVAQAHMVRAEPPVKWKTGAEFTKALRAPIDRTGNDRPLGESLAALSRSMTVAVLLDRRVDPGQLVHIDAHGITLGTELKDLATTIDLGVAILGPVVYVGPKPAAARIEAVGELRRREAATTSTKGWQTNADSSWDELSEPRQLAQAITERAGAKLVNLQAIPHDVWATWSGPPMLNIDCLTLVLAGFDLTFEISDDGTEVTIVPVPADLVYERTYDVVGTVATVTSDLKQILPDLKVRAVGSKSVRVVGNAEQHTQVAELLAGKKTTAKTTVIPGDKVYTFKAENQLIGAMVQTLAKERGLKVQAAESIVEKLKQRGTVEVEKASFEAALKKVLDPVGIKFKVTDEVLELSE